MRRAYLLAFILVVLCLVVITRQRFRRDPAPRRPSTPVVPAAPKPAPARAPDAAPAPAPPPERAEKPGEPATEAPKSTGWLNVRLDLGGEPPGGNFHII